MKAIYLICLSTVALSFVTHAIPVVFDLRDTTATTEIESGVIVRGGVTATLTSNVAGSSGVLNQTANGFGVNASGTDVTDQIDNGDGVESVSIVFDTDVVLTKLVLSSFTTSEQMLLTIGGFPSMTVVGTAAASDIYTFSMDNSVTAGQAVVLEYSTGNGFSFDSFTVEEVAAPDTGATALLLSIPLFGLFALRRFNPRTA